MEFCDECGNLLPPGEREGTCDSCGASFEREADIKYTKAVDTEYSENTEQDAHKTRSERLPTTESGSVKNQTRCSGSTIWIAPLQLNYNKPLWKSRAIFG